MSNDNPFIGMTPREFNEWLDEQARMKQCAYCPDSFIPINDEDFCCDACELQFYEEREIEVLNKEEKKGKCF